MKKNILMLLAILLIHNTAYASTLSDKLSDSVVQNRKVVSTVDIGISVQELQDTFKKMFLYDTDFWNVQGNLKWDENNKQVTKIFLEYKYNDNISEKNSEIEATVNKIATEALCLNKQYERAEFVYNYLLKYFDYSKEDNPTLYDLVSDKKGNCHAFAQLYQLIMRKLNIPCESVVSTSMNHQWNIIKIDGKWYNVDCSLASMCKNYNLYNTWFCKSDKFFEGFGYKIDKPICFSGLYDYN